MRAITFLVLFVASTMLFAQNFNPAGFRYSVHKTHDNILVDGILNEQAWSEIEPASAFWQHYPLDTVNAVVPTIVKMTYNDKYIYISAQCVEEQGSPVVQNLIRDENASYWNSDAFSIAVDPMDNNKSGYFFGMNAGGGMQDGTISQQTLQPNLDMFWNNSWEGKVTVDSNGYNYEFAIPFSALKFDPTNNVWGFNFIRNDMKRNAFDIWTKFATAYNGFDFAFNGQVVFEDKLPQLRSNRLELTPSVSGKAFRNIENGELAKSTVNGGLDAKYAVSENINLDLALLPDFSTVEVDKQYIDFYRYEYKVAEQRSLFLENNDLFSLPGSDEDFSIVPPDAYRIKPLYTRRIGIKDWQNIPITYGAKLSGSTKNDLRFGIFNVQVESHEDDATQNYSAIGFQHPVLKNSLISGIVLNRQSIKQPQGEKINTSEVADYNRNAGLEFDYISNNNKFSASMLFHKNFAPGQIKKSGFYGTEIDYRSKAFRTRNSIYHVEENFIADMGYVPRLFHYDDVADTTYRVAYTEVSNVNSLTFFPGTKIRAVKFSSRISAYMHHDGLNEIKTHLSNFYEFENRSMFMIGVNYNDFDLLYSNDVLKNDSPLPAGNYKDLSGFIHFFSNPLRSISYEVMADYGKFYNGRKLFTDVKLIYKIQPWAVFSLNYNLCEVDLPDFSQKELFHLVGGRADINFTRDISWTTLMQYNTQIDNVNINSLFKWRYRPLSDFQVVVKNDADLEFRQKQWQVVFKLNYWLQI